MLKGKKPKNIHAERKSVLIDKSSARIDEGAKCIPMLARGWQSQGKENLMIYDHSDKQYHYAITTGDYLTCVYGGLIKVLEVAIISTNLSSWNISVEGFEALKNHETNYSTLQGWGLGKFDANNALIGIYPHYVFRIGKTSGQWESDGGITFGFGHYVSQSEYQTDQSEKALVDQYAKGASMQ